MSVSLSLYLAAQTRRTSEIRAECEQQGSHGALEEIGQTSLARPEGTLVWLHAPNTSKAVVLATLIRQLAENWPLVRFLLTTPRSKDAVFASGVLPPNCTHQFAPADVPEFVEAFLTHWQPNIAVFTGIELGPATVISVSNARIPLLLIDAKLDAKTFKSLRETLAGRRGLMREVLRRFDYIDTADATSMNSLISLGVEGGRLRISGAMDEVSTTLPCNEEDRAELAQLLVGRPIWLASNIPESEDAAVLSAHLAVSRTAHRLLLILSPDTPQRGPDLAAKFAADGVRTRLRSLGEIPDDETQVYIADTLDERGLWYRLATVSFLGSSLAAKLSVQTPFEAAGLGSAILHGPNLGAHRAAFAALDNEGGARQVRNAESLAAALLTLLAPDQSAAMAHAAWEHTTKGAQATDLAIERIETMLEDIGAY